MYYVKKNPIPKEHCSRIACPLKNIGCKEKCQVEGVAYVSRCKRCWEGAGEEGEKVYIGESSRSVYTRAQGHYTDLKSKMKSGKGTFWMAHLGGSQRSMDKESPLGGLGFFYKWEL